MRKYKQVKEKKVTYSLPEWAEVERRAASMNLKTGTYIKRISVNGQINYYDMKEVAPLVNGMRTISNNINQIARKVNETGSVFEGDIKLLQKDFSEICRMLNMFLAELQLEKA